MDELRGRFVINWKWKYTILLWRAFSFLLFFKYKTYTMVYLNPAKNKQINSDEASADAACRVHCKVTPPFSDLAPYCRKKTVLSRPNIFVESHFIQIYCLFFVKTQGGNFSR